MFKSFGGRLLAAILGTIIGVFVVFLVFFGGASVSLSGMFEDIGELIKKDTEIKDSTILYISLDSPIAESYEYDPLAGLDFRKPNPEMIGLVQAVGGIDSAAIDDRIKGILLSVPSVQGGYASIRELREALLRFKAQGKFVIAYSEWMTERAYYLCSVADEVYMMNYGYVEFNGISSERIFLKGMLEKLGVEPLVFKAGDFKSATEPLVRKSMSDSSRYQTEIYLESLLNTMHRDIGDDLDREVTELRSIADSMKVKSTEDAEREGLISAVRYYDQVLDTLRSRIGLDSAAKINSVSLGKYREALKDKQFGVKKLGQPEIAVVVAQGEIVMEGDKMQISANRLCRLLRKIRANDTIKAVVLRINSPGGSAMASEKIWRELSLLSQTKPLITSMSDVAASGGYYMAVASDHIMAQRNTITGSIGVWGVLMNISGLLEDKLGITVDRVKTGPYADVPSFTREMTPNEKEMVQSEVDAIYEQFMTRVADGRNLTPDIVAKLAKGRVYSGSDAMDVQLIDSFGNLQDAIALAAERAGLDSTYVVGIYPKQKTYLDKLFESLAKGSNKSKTELELLWPYYKSIIQMAKYENHVQMRMPFDLEIQ